MINIMINIPLFIAFIFIVIIIAFIIYISATSIQKYVITAQTIALPATTLCIADRTKLVQIDDNKDVCCYNNGVKTGAYLVETKAPNIIPNQPPVNLQFSAIPVQTFYITVCREYCNSGYILTTTGNILCNGETVITAPQSSLANECASITRPVNPNGTPCRGSALPIAVVNNNLLFGLHVNSTGTIPQCPVVGSC